MIIDKEHLILPKWQAPKSVRVVSTTRSPGTSNGAYASNNLSYCTGDDPGSVAGNWRNVQHSLDYDSLATVTQIHGNRVISARDAIASKCRGDAIWSDIPGVACAILTADCLPVVLVSNTADLVSVVHCGWRGLAAGIIAKTVGYFNDASSIHAWIGPGICQKCYQVDKAVYCSLAQYPQCFYASATDRWQCDLASVARQQLAESGVTQVISCDLCTYEQSHRIYSYRRDGQTGRIATLAWIAHD